jgi:HAD superfamily hydrolase (TIGR01509 family)
MTNIINEYKDNKCASKTCSAEIADKKLIIFDWDGTLVNSNEQCFEACKVVFDECKIPLDKTTFLEFDSNPQKNILKDYGLEKYRPLYNEIFFGLCKQTPIPLNNHAKEVILQLRKEGKKVAIATNGPADFVQDMIKSLEYDTLFDCIVGIDKDIKLKPAPDMLYRVIDNLSMKKTEAVYIGDAPRDIECAKNAGVVSIAFTGGSFGYSILKESDPDYIINDIEEIINYAAN